MTQTNNLINQNSQTFYCKWKNILLLFALADKRIQQCPSSLASFIINFITVFKIILTGLGTHLIRFILLKLTEKQQYTYFTNEILHSATERLQLFDRFSSFKEIAYKSFVQLLTKTAFHRISKTRQMAKKKIYKGAERKVYDLKLLPDVFEILILSLIHCFLKVEFRWGFFNDNFFLFFFFLFKKERRLV